MTDNSFIPKVSTNVTMERNTPLSRSVVGDSKEFPKRMLTHLKSKFKHPITRVLKNELDNRYCANALVQSKNVTSQKYIPKMTTRKGSFVNIREASDHFRPQTKSPVIYSFDKVNEENFDPNTFVEMPISDKDLPSINVPTKNSNSLL